jgi:addiction module RelE/StbE family toxin
MYQGFCDTAKSGPWKGYRGSWLSGGWRVLYKVEKEKLVVEVERVSNHDYKGKK